MLFLYLHTGVKLLPCAQRIPDFIRIGNDSIATWFHKKEEKSRSFGKTDKDFEAHDIIFNLVGPVKDKELEARSSSLHSFPTLINLDGPSGDQVKHWTHKCCPYTVPVYQTGNYTFEACPITYEVKSRSTLDKGLPL